MGVSPELFISDHIQSGNSNKEGKKEKRKKKKEKMFIVDEFVFVNLISPASI